MKKVLKLRSFASTRDITRKIEAVKYNSFEKPRLLDYNFVYSDERQQPFRRNMTPPLSRAKCMQSKKTDRRVASIEEPHIDFLHHLLFDSEDELDIFL